MLFINDSSYLPEETSTEIQPRTQLRENEVPFVQISSSDSASKLKDHLIIAAKALRNKDPGEELQIDYASE